MNPNQPGEDQTGDDEPGDDEGEYGPADEDGVEDHLPQPLGYGLEESADCFVDGLGDGVE